MRTGGGRQLLHAGRAPPSGNRCSGSFGSEEKDDGCLCLRGPHHAGGELCPQNLKRSYLADPAGSNASAGVARPKRERPPCNVGFRLRRPAHAAPLQPPPGAREPGLPRRAAPHRQRRPRRARARPKRSTFTKRRTKDAAFAAECDAALALAHARLNALSPPPFTVEGARGPQARRERPNPASPASPTAASSSVRRRAASGVSTRPPRQRW
jgi:hypothetical protein